MKTCAKCPTELGARNRSGLCRRCVGSRPHSAETKAKIRAAILQRLENTDYREQHVARAVALSKNPTPEALESRRRHGRKMASRLVAANAAMTADMRAENGRKRSATVLAWCPPEWRAKYRDLKQRGRSAAEAKRWILDALAGRSVPRPYAFQRARLDWCPPARREEYAKARRSLGAAEARRIIEADLTPFERQMARVAAGGSIRTVRPLPKAEYGFTLGGVATGQL